MVRAVGGLLSGSVVGQLMMLVSTLLVARWVAPAHYALLGVVLSGAFLLNSFNTCAVELRIPVVGELDLAALLRVGITAAWLVSAVPFVVGAVLFVLAPGSVVGPLLCAIALGAAAAAMQTFVLALYTRKQAFGALTRMRIIQTSTNAVGMVALSSLFGNWEALAGAWLFSVVVGTAAAGRDLGGALRPGRPRPGDLGVVLREVGPAPLTQLLSGISTNLVLLALPLLAGTTVAGEWALVSRVFGAALTTVVATAQPLYIARAAQHLRDRQLLQARSWHASTMRRLLLCTIPMFVGSAVVIRVVMPSLSDDWSGVGIVLPAAVAAYTAQSVAAPLTGTLMLLGRFAVDLRWEIVRVTGAIGAILLGSSISGAAAVNLWAAVTVVLYAGLLSVHHRQLNPTKTLT